MHSVDWVVTEKIHGANFVVATDGKSVRFAKRKAWLENEEEFFGYQLLRPTLTPRALRLFSDIQKQDTAVQAVFIYGELFGGSYPHPDVPADPRVEAIQTGVYYSPTIQYAVFDLATLSISVQRRYLAYEEVRRCAQESDLFVLPPLYVGAYSKAISYPLGFESKIPLCLGYPALRGPNKAEGVVIKPVQSLVLPSGERIRPILKRKIPEFKEDTRFMEARKWKAVAKTILDEQAAAGLLFDELEALLTPQRFANALSKVGRLDQSAAHRQQLQDVVWEDVLSVFNSNHGDLWNMMSSPARRELECSARKKIAFWISLTDGQNAPSREFRSPQ